MRQIEPKLSVAAIDHRVNLRQPQDRARLFAALRKAGLPE